ncbi:unnamed protein product, partial [Pelagomonas calceolata]
IYLFILLLVQDLDEVRHGDPRRVVRRDRDVLLAEGDLRERGERDRQRRALEGGPEPRAAGRVGLVLLPPLAQQGRVLGRPVVRRDLVAGGEGRTVELLLGVGAAGRRRRFLREGAERRGYARDDRARKGAPHHFLLCAAAGIMAAPVECTGSLRPAGALRRCTIKPAPLLGLRA